MFKSLLTFALVLTGVSFAQADIDTNDESLMNDQEMMSTMEPTTIDADDAMMSSMDPTANRRWRDYGTACGPQQPWGTSRKCPNTSPNGGPIGMKCNHLPRNTKCYGARYWDRNFICTNPNNGQDTRGSYIFNMYICK